MTQGSVPTASNPAKRRKRVTSAPRKVDVDFADCGNGKVNALIHVRPSQRGCRTSSERHPARLADGHVWLLPHNPAYAPILRRQGGHPRQGSPCPAPTLTFAETLAEPMSGLALALALALESGGAARLVG
jgi:hypothetical protein